MANNFVNERPNSLNLPPVGGQKTCSSITPPGTIFHSIDDVGLYMEKFLDLLVSGVATPAVLQPTIFTLCTNLKVYGTNLEAYCKDLLNRVFVSFRKCSMDETLDTITRISLLEVIELRTGNWQIHEPTVSYYSKKLSNLLEDTTNTPDVASGRQLPIPPFVTARFTLSHVSSPPTPVDQQQPIQSSGSVVESVSPFNGQEPNDSGALQTATTPASSTSGGGSFSSLLNDFGSLSLSSDFQQTVTVGSDSINITGKNHKLVQTAKRLLDGFFATINLETPQGPIAASTDNSDDAIKKKVAFMRYDRNALVHFSNSPLCRGPPSNFDLLLLNFPEIVRCSAEVGVKQQLEVNNNSNDGHDDDASLFASPFQ